MIRLLCRCGHTTHVPDDQAGLTAQCRQCGKLLDIPLLSDLSNLEVDGTFKLDESPGNPGSSLSSLAYVYHPARQLPDGTDIDLRGPVEPPEEAGGAIQYARNPVNSPAPPHLAGEIPFAQEPPEHTRPKYDPQTGEIVQPHEIRTTDHTAPPSELPQARRTLDYDLGAHSLDGIPHGWGVFLALLQPVNLVVMSFIVAGHVALFISGVVANVLPLVIMAPFAVAAFLVGHYAAVVEEIGPGEKDELPRPLRNVSFWDDYFSPFVCSAFSAAVCYWPIWVILVRNFLAAIGRTTLPYPDAGAYLLPLLVIGHLFFPAVFLTVCTSGNLGNLRPDRVVKLIWTIGWRYLGYVLLWWLATAAYVGILFAAAYAGFVVSAFFLMLAIYIAHAFCWLLGLDYRLHWSEYPWTAQVHKPQTVTLARRGIHPKLTAAQDNAAQRAAARPRRDVR